METTKYRDNNVYTIFQFIYNTQASMDDPCSAMWGYCDELCHKNTAIDVDQVIMNTSVLSDSV